MAHLLEILFIGLKLGNVINWSWWYVMMPYEILFGLLFISKSLDYYLRKTDPAYALEKSLQDLIRRR